ncbi:CWF19-like protein 2 homolog [Gryllus bimaculatus]|nr:CWF19-like protein 2 homolog [Gryllus bimaculatus]
MSYINFESARIKEELRNEKRKAREAVLEKAEADYKRRKEREQRAAERGEDKWMLPSLDAQLQPVSQKKKKKHKKEKKKKKDKKHKSKKKHDSSDSSDSSGEEAWVEKGAETSQPSANSGPAQRDEWMTLPALFPCVSRDQIRAQKRQEAPQDEETLKKKFLLDNPGQSERELNPFWKDGGKGLPQVEEPMPDSLSLAANSAGDHGLAWLRRAMRRVQEQAKEQGRSEEAVAAERWGSLEKLRSMLAEAERRCRTRPRDRGRGPRGGRVQGTAPKPREYEDWRDDPTAGAAGESAEAQSEAVGDKARYRSWLGLKAPSPPKEPSSDEEDDFDYDKLDDPPVVEGPDIRGVGEKDNEKGNVSEKDASEDDNDGEANGKILFRSSKIRKEQPLFNKLRYQTKERLNVFGQKYSDKKEKDKAEDSDDVDDDKLFEEWRNERRTKDDESEDETAIRSESDVVESKKDGKNIEEKQKVKQTEETGRADSRKIHPVSSEDLRERYFQSRNKGGPMKDNIEKEGKTHDYKIKDKEYVEKKRGDCSLKEDNSFVINTNSSLANKEKNKNLNIDPKDGKESEDEKEGYREYRNSRRDDRRRDREKIDYLSRERRQDEDRKERRQDERDTGRIENVKDRYADLRHIRRSENESQRSQRERDREDYRDSKYRRREEQEESMNRSSAERHTGSRRTGIPNYIRKHDASPKHYERAPTRKLEGFQKPVDDLHISSKSMRHDILGDAGTYRGSSSVKNWKKKEFQKAEEKREIAQNEPPPPPPLAATKVLPTIHPAQVKEKEEEKQPDLQMSDAEMNALGAKVLKAEIMGNHVLATKLKAQLQQAQASRKQRKEAPATAAAAKPQEEETVILTHRDSKGFVRPIGGPSHPEPSGGRRRPQKVATHGADGLRERFFPDDDKYTLENMFQKEKMTTIEDANEEFSRLAAKGSSRADSEYDLDDVFAEKASREKAPGKLQVLERNRAIQQHKRIERSLDSCTHCFDSPKMLKHLMIALGSKVYLSLPAHQSLTEGHCLISPIHHVPCATQLDEDVWDEMSSFRKALVAMFLEQDQDCVFFESAMHLRRFPHMVLECVPVPREVGDTAPIYFKKAIMESEAEWSMNKKLVDLKGKGVRRAVPKGLPYFAVDFGNDDGFAHVIEDERLFPENFAQEIIGGMMDLDHSLWRKQRRENFDTQRKKVIDFAEMWKKHDITKKTEDNSSSSSESDKE